MQNRKILQLRSPESGEPLCSGVELSVALGQHVQIRYFHAVISIKNGRANSWYSLMRDNSRALEVSVRTFGQNLESHQVAIDPSDIGKTLFCVGYPCLSITGLDTESGTLTVTLSEIVELCGDGEPCSL
ncbi:MAG: hypothetical protein K2Y32_10345 [Candidatus Obscuribacterales bacterium]|nr:hypothetical protein [Candidatus Obscuribacterales bacterium]